MNKKRKGHLDYSFINYVFFFKYNFLKGLKIHSYGRLLFLLNEERLCAVPESN